MKRSFKSTFASILLLLVTFGLSAQEMQVTGKVTSNSDGQSVPGVTVLVKNSQIGTVTNADGEYVIQANQGDVLVFSFIGMKSQEAVVEKSTINIKLEEDFVGLDEVVAIGYGTQRKKDLSAAVGSVSADDFKVQPITEVEQVLQGRTAGVSVIKSSGAPGGTAKIRIRGANSIMLSNEPLYVIDGFVGADFGAINPNDIEDLQILKDASATAIYGSRGANGVVLITTKTGKRGQNKVSFRANFSMSDAINRWDLLGAGDYAQTANDYNQALGTTPQFTDDEVSGFYKNGGTDWQDEVLRTAYGQDYQLTISGGSDNASYYVSGNYTNQEGVVTNSNYKRFSLRTNVSSTFSEKLKAKFVTNFIHKEDLNNGGGGGKRNTLNQMVNWAPTTPAYLPDGSINPKDSVGANFESPLELATNTNLGITNKFTANGNLIYTIIPGLSLDIGLGGSFKNYAGKTFTQGLLMGLEDNFPEKATRNSHEQYYVANTNVLTYKKVFNNVHNMTLTAVNEQTMSSYDQFGVNATGLLYPDFEYNNLSLLDETAGLLSGFTTNTKRTIQSYVGRANYIYKDKYHFTASFRRDGSSVFQGDNKWANFPSLSGGWTISQEDFFNVSFINNLKARASWGLTGNQNVDVYTTRALFKTSPPKDISTSFENGTSVAGIILGDPGNTDLKWETTEQINFGVDIAVLNNKASLSVDYFKKNTYDLLIKLPVPSYAGAGALPQNVGEVLNKGWEFEINAEPIRTSDFSWNTNFNMTFLHNEVLDLGDRKEFFPDQVETEEGRAFIVREGEQLTSFYGLSYLGTWKEGQEDEAAKYNNVPGDARYKDLNDDGIIDDADKGIIGSGVPTGTFGWNNNLTYRRWNMNIFFQAITGFDRLNYTYATSVIPGLGSAYVEHQDIQGRWDAETNPNSDVPHFSSSTKNYILSSNYVEDASFLRLKNLSLSYNLPFGTNQNVTFMAAASNLLTFTKYRGLDPEAFTNNAEAKQDAAAGLDIGAYPNSKTYTFSVKVNF